MPLKKLLLRPGVSRENTRYASEVLGPRGADGGYVAGWYACDKVRFRSGTPEKIGGWSRISSDTFLGVCRSLFLWSRLTGQTVLGVGTHLKFYVELGGTYSDITPIRATTSLTDPFTATNGSATITVSDTAHGCITGDYVTFSGATGLGGNITADVLNQEYQVTVVDADSYTFTATATANTTDAAGSPGGGTVSAAYQLNVGNAVETPVSGWGAGAWGSGTWGVGLSSTSEIRLWSQSNFGEDLIFAPRSGQIYYWDSSAGVTSRGVLLSSLVGASDVPTVQNFIFVSDISRFVFAFGANDVGSSAQDPMLIRWSDQEDATNWTPSATNQAGSLRLSNGSELVAAVQTRQELIVFSDSAVYSLQFLGAPDGWGAQILSPNISIISPNAAIAAAGQVFWMGVDKFYKYDGRVQPLRCDLRQYIYGDINTLQAMQVFCGTNEGFNEIWWFYCSADSTTVDRYVVYNYMEDIWYYGTMARTAWLDSGLREYPVAATYVGNIVEHENGVDDNTTATSAAIDAYIESTEFDIDDGHNFGFVWRVVPDVTFRGSNPPGGSPPQVTMSLIPLQNSGSGYNDPQSVGGSSSAAITRVATVPVEEFTGQVYIRVRGRQMVFKIESDRLGTTWQLGAPRIDIRPDGRR